MAIEFGPKDRYRTYGVPSLDLPFADRKSLVDIISGNNLITFTRAQSGNEATYVGSDGLIKTASANEPRFDHNPLTRESLGLLVEEARTNDFTYSEQFDNAVWTKTNSAVTPNNITAPNGLLVGTLLSSSASGAASVNRNFTNQVRGVSIYLKSASSSTANVNLQSNVVGRNVSYNVNLASGTISVGTGNTGNLSGWTEYASITNIVNGWYRIFIAFYSSTTTVNTTYSVSPSTNGSASSANESIYIWGAQHEAAYFPTSYIPTTGSTVTRAADIASITGTNFSSWYNQSEGSYFVKSATLSPTFQQRIFRASAASGSEEVAIQFSGSNATPGLYSDGGNSSGATRYTSISLSTYTTTFAVAYKQLNFAVVNASQVVGNISGGVALSPVFTQAEIGAVNGGQRLSGTIKRLTYYQTRLPNATLQGLTST